MYFYQEVNNVLPFLDADPARKGVPIQRLQEADADEGFRRIFKPTTQLKSISKSTK